MRQRNKACLSKAQSSIGSEMGHSKTEEDEARILSAVGLAFEELPSGVHSGVAALAAEVLRLREDTARLQLAVAKAEKLADFDPLCPVFNRRAFERELAREIALCERHGTELALLYLDLDDFKRINDTHGHSIGDQVLIAIATLLRQSIRKTDIIGRLGGDEFAILLPRASNPNALRKAYQLQTLIDEMHLNPIGKDDGKGISFGASSGVACWSPGQTPEMLIDAADEAMFKRKFDRQSREDCSDSETGSP